MNITNIDINNFKFHTEISIPIQKNMLLYGENGTGKSSIYWALHSLLKKEQTENMQELQKRGSSEPVLVNITFDDSTTNIDSISNEYFHTIHFANQDLLESIIDYDTNFYKVIDIQLRKYFNDYDVYYDKFSIINTKLGEVDDSEEVILLNNEREEYRQLFKTKLETIESIANDILHNEFHEKNTTLSFSYDWGKLNDSASAFSVPSISLNINNISAIKHNFNEAKLKLSSLSIFLAFIKQQSEEHLDNALQLLVLDDFLTSLDMANRKLIIEYILKEFKNYQIIILTHNLQFFNLIKKSTNNWDIKKLFTLKEESGYKTYVKSSENYIDEAKKFIQTEHYDLEIAGNKLRKAFEEIVQEFEQQLELGKVEAFHKIITSLKNDDTVFFNEPHKEITNLLKTFSNIFKNTQNDTDKIKTLKNIIQTKQEKNTIKIEIDDSDNLKYLIDKTNIYKSILLNPSSHNDIQSELYHKECENTIELLELLGELLLKIKGNN